MEEQMGSSERGSPKSNCTYFHGMGWACRSAPDPFLNVNIHAFSAHFSIAYPF